MIMLRFLLEWAVLGDSDSLGTEVFKVRTFWRAAGGSDPAYVGSDKMTFTVPSGRDWSGRDDRMCLGYTG